jgi:hypothetical protein
MIFNTSKYKIYAFFILYICVAGDIRLANIIQMATSFLGRTDTEI